MLDSRREPGPARLLAGSRGPKEVIASIELRIRVRNGRPGCPMRAACRQVWEKSGLCFTIWIKMYESYNNTLVRVQMLSSGSVRAPSPA